MIPGDEARDAARQYRAWLIATGAIKPREGLKSTYVPEGFNGRRNILIDEAGMTIIRIQPWHR